MAYLVLGSWPVEEHCAWAPFHGLGLKSKETVVGDSYSFSATVACVYLAGRSPLKDLKGF